MGSISVQEVIFSRKSCESIATPKFAPAAGYRIKWYYYPSSISRVKKAAKRRIFGDTNRREAAKTFFKGKNRREAAKQLGDKYRREAAIFLPCRKSKIKLLETPALFWLCLAWFHVKVLLPKYLKLLLFA